MGDASLFWRADYEAADEPQACAVPDRRYLALDVDAAEARADLGDLLAVAREIHTISGGSAAAYGDMPLEGFWYADDQPTFDPELNGAWCWTAAVCLPDLVGDELANLVVGHVAGQSAKRIAVHTLHEGYVIQALHRGRFDTVAQTLARIGAYLEAHHLTATGTYHEIYLTDPLTTAADDARTIVRQPCRANAPAGLRPPTLLDPDRGEASTNRRGEIRPVPAGPGSPSLAWAARTEPPGSWEQPVVSGRRRWRRPRS